MSDSPREAIQYFAEDRWQAHQILFRRRHPEESCEAHRAIVELIHGTHPRQGIEGFRGIAKSTLIEEAAVIRKCYGDFRNMVIVGASYSRAVDRLASIKREFEVNRYLVAAFGDLRGPTWQEGKIVFSDESCIQAIGRGQSMTGIKHLDWRPDAALVDDLEDPDEGLADSEREKTWRWFIETFLPSLDHPLRSWVRVLGTRRGAGSLPERLEKDGWPVAKFPIEYPAPETGERVATWPAKFPLPVIDRMKETYRGDLHTWEQEFMCQAVPDATRVFTRAMLRVEPRERTFEAVYAMIDPARTAHGKAASTGYAVWSWLHNRLIVWAADALFLLPDEIVALGFDVVERFDPVWLQVERDGLEQFLLQPFRAEQLRRGYTIPLKPIRAIEGTRGRGQTQFIGGGHGLQPYFAAGEVSFAQPLPALEEQLLSFPHGIRDAVNALAYAPMTRPAAPIYEGFGPQHVVEDLQIQPGRKLFLAANATGAMTAAVLLQAEASSVRVLADWVCEGPPFERVPEIAEAAALFGEATRLVAPRQKAWEAMLQQPAPDRLVLRRLPLAWVVPPHHQERYTNIGLMQAVRQLPGEVRLGRQEAMGQIALREALGRLVRGVPAVEIGTQARWTLRALAGGYTRAIVHGRLQDEPEPGPYRLLMEGLESFLALVRTGATAEKEDDEEQNFRIDERTGRRYVSAMPQRGR